MMKYGPLTVLETAAERSERRGGNGFIDGVAPGVVLPTGDDVVLRVDVGNHLPVVVIHVPRHSLLRRRGDAPSKHIEDIRLDSDVSSTPRLARVVLGVTPDELSVRILYSVHSDASDGRVCDDAPDRPFHFHPILHRR